MRGGVGVLVGGPSDYRLELGSAVTDVPVALGPLTAAKRRGPSPRLQYFAADQHGLLPRVRAHQGVIRVSGASLATSSEATPAEVRDRVQLSVALARLNT